MRVAFSGAHRTGKTTLLEAIASLVPAYQVIEEPYRALEDEGYEFCDPPSRDDYERQLRCAIDAIRSAPADALIDRSPVDFIAYLRAIDDGELAIEDWLLDLRDAMAALDAIVLVAIETPDRIALPSGEDRRLRRAVDASIQALVLDDPFGFDIPVIEVHGDLDTRVRQVMRALR